MVKYTEEETTIKQKNEEKDRRRTEEFAREDWLVSLVNKGGKEMKTK